MFSNIFPNIFPNYLQKELEHFGLDILVIHGILEHVVLNIFKYLFDTFVSKSEKNYSQRFLNYIKCRKDFNTLKLQTLKTLLSKNRFYISSDPH